MMEVLSNIFWVFVAFVAFIFAIAMPFIVFEVSDDLRKGKIKWQQ